MIPNRANTPATTNINVTVDALSNRHAISSYVYGGAYPQDAPTITDSGLSVVRWGGNATSRYNWQLFTYNAANDYYFEDFNYSEIGDARFHQIHYRREERRQPSSNDDGHAALGRAKRREWKQRPLEFFRRQIWRAVRRRSLTTPMPATA